MHFDAQTARAHMPKGLVALMDQAQGAINTEASAAASEGVRAIAVSHRIGVLNIGDAALVAAVSADHRAAAFRTCALLVDTVKERLPVWKHQFFADGTDEWVNSA